MPRRNRVLLAVLACARIASAAVIAKRNEYKFLQNDTFSDTVFSLGEVSYLANTKHPKASVGYSTSGRAGDASWVPVTVVKTNETVVTRHVLGDAIAAYLEGDDVFSEDFLHGVYVSSSGKSYMDASAVEYLAELNSSWLLLDSSITADTPVNKAVLQSSVDLPAGPYLASIGATAVSFATVYRLYEDTQKTFLFGAYDANDGEANHNALGVFLPKYWDPMIPFVRLFSSFHLILLNHIQK